MIEQEKSTMDDADGNCRQCGHPFNPHIVVACDVSDFQKEARYAALWRDAAASTAWTLISRKTRDVAERPGRNEVDLLAQ
ncbi:MAG: hypothetical protein WA476_07035 [Acidobacteriaceae bacterium]